jgi:hypothetical protein
MQRQRLLTRTPMHSEHGSVAAHEGGAADALSGSGELFEVTKRTPACFLLTTACHGLGLHNGEPLQ